MAHKTTGISCLTALILLLPLLLQQTRLEAAPRLNDQDSPAPLSDIRLLESLDVSPAALADVTKPLMAKVHKLELKQGKPLFGIVLDPSTDPIQIFCRKKTSGDASWLPISAKETKAAPSEVQKEALEVFGLDQLYKPFHGRALPLLTPESDPTQRAQALQDLGNFCRKLNDYPHAVQHLGELRELRSQQIDVSESQRAAYEQAVSQLESAELAWVDSETSKTSDLSKQLKQEQFEGAFEQINAVLDQLTQEAARERLREFAESAHETLIKAAAKDVRRQWLEAARSVSADIANNASFQSTMMEIRKNMRASIAENTAAFLKDNYGVYEGLTGLPMPDLPELLGKSRPGDSIKASYNEGSWLVHPSFSEIGNGPLAGAGEVQKFWSSWRGRDRAEWILAYYMEYQAGAAGDGEPRAARGKPKDCKGACGGVGHDGSKRKVPCPDCHGVPKVVTVTYS